MRRARPVLALAAVLAIGAIIAIVLLPSDPVAPNAESRAVGIIVRTYDAQGDLSWEIAAARGSLEGEDARLEEVEVTFSGVGGALLVATAATLSLAAERFELLGNVTAERNGAYRLSTDAVHWSSTEGDLTGAATTLEFEHGWIAGERFSYDPSSERASLAGEVHGMIEFDGTAILRCGRADWIGDLLVLLEQVEVEHGDRTYRSERAEAPTTLESVTFLGEAEFVLPFAIISADRVTVAEDGISAAGAVAVSLRPEFFAVEDDA